MDAPLKKILRALSLELGTHLKAHILKTEPGMPGISNVG